MLSKEEARALMMIATATGWIGNHDIHFALKPNRIEWGYSTTRICERLRQLGLIETRQDPSDARAKQHRLRVRQAA